MREQLHQMKEHNSSARCNAKPQAARCSCEANSLVLVADTEAVTDALAEPAIRKGTGKPR